MSFYPGRTTEDNKTSNVFYDETFNYVYKKSERILHAIYLITNLIKDSEPLRDNIRQSAIQLLKDTVESDVDSATEKDIVARRIIRHLAELLSLLSVAESARLVSAMNHSIVKREIQGLISLLAERYDRGRDAVVLDAAFFGVSALPTQPRQPRSVRESFKDVGELSLKSDIKSSQTPLVSTMSFIKPVNKIVRNSDAKSSRKDSILAVIKDKGSVSIGDISSVISDCSEKTIQRELLALVSEGVVRKEGERRWSTYTLA